MRHDPWLGWDLGGAHLKAVQLDGRGRVEVVVQVACPLWQGLDRLEDGISQVLERIGARATRHALTMTGELADCFADRAAGVAALIGVMRRRLAGERLLVYAGPLGLLAPDAALDAVTQVASTNWMATASLAATLIPEGLLIDIGSTTTDLVPFQGGRVTARGMTDHARLAVGELIYTGVARTSLMALARHAPFDGHWIPLMAEYFATTADVYRLTGELPEHADLLPSADGRAKTAQASAARLARLLGLDAGAADLAGWRRVACYLAERQLRDLADGVARILSRGELTESAPLVGAGVGRFLVTRLAQRLGRPAVGFDTFFGSPGFESSGITAPDVADCAPAAALARLAANREVA